MCILLCVQVTVYSNFVVSFTSSKVFMLQAILCMPLCYEKHAIPNEYCCQ